MSPTAPAPTDLRRAPTDPRPEPVGTATIDELTGVLRDLRTWAGNPSYTVLTQRVARARLARGVPRSEAVPGRVTVYDCFREGRRRLDVDLVLDLVGALGGDLEDRVRWRQALQGVLQPGTAPVPAQLVADPPVAHVVGRAREHRLVAAAAGRGPVLVTGMPGVGKTSTALRVARDLADQQDGAVLLLDLGGSTAGPGRVDVGAAAAALLLQVRPEAQPGDLAGVLDGLRAATGTRRHVLVLDDAGSAEEVVPLLRAGDWAAVLVTSRHQLPDLPEQVVLEGLTREAGLELLEASSGQPLTDEDSAGELVDLTGGLPLALTLLGRRLAAQPDWPVADHLDAVRDRLRLARLDEPVDTALQVTYEEVGPGLQQLLRTLTWHPTRTLGLDAVAALSGRPAEELAPQLDQLVRANLLHRVTEARWELHQLVHAFATARSLEQDSPSLRSEATTRLLRSCLEQVSRAVATLHPASVADWYWTEGLDTEGTSPAPDTAPGPAPDGESAGTTGSSTGTDGTTGEVDGEAWALCFLSEERATLLACADRAAEQGHPELAVRLAVVLAPRLWQQGGVEATFQLQLAARVAAQRTQDDLAMALTERNLGQTLLRAGRFAQAGPYLDRALVSYRAAGHARGEISVLNAQGYLASSVGDDRAAVAIFEELLQRLDPAEVRWAVAGSNLAVALVRAGERTRAVQILREVARTAAAAGWAEREQVAQSNLSGLLAEHGDPQEGRRSAERALHLATVAGDEVGTAYALSNLALALDSCGDGDGAESTARRALAASRELEAPDLEASVLTQQGQFARRRGDDELARQRYAAALAVAERIGEASVAQRARTALEQLGSATG